MNIIDSYQFGLIVVNDESYTSDVLIFPDRVKDNWRRRTSHQLHLDELSEALAEMPEVLVIGTGASGLMKVLPEAEQALEALGIKLIGQPTNEACQTYNRLCQSQKVVAALHLTC